MRRTLVVLLGAALLAGCGDGGDKTSKVTPLEQFKLDADTACQERDDFVAKLGQPRTLEDYATQGEKVVEADAKLVDALKQADPPAKQRADFERYIGVQRRLNAINAERARAAKTGSRGAVDDAAYSRRRLPLRAEQRRLARELGLIFCGAS